MIPNIVANLITVESPTIPSWAQILFSVLALAMSGFALLWQRTLVDRQLKHQLYQKRFDCQLVLLRFQRLTIFSHVTPPIRLFKDGQPYEDKLELICGDYGYYSPRQITDLVITLRHIAYLFDSHTVQIADQLAAAADKYRSKLNHIIFSSGPFSPLTPSDFFHLAPERDAVTALAKALTPCLSASLQLYQDPWWIRLRNHIDAWEEQVTNGTPDAQSPPPAN